MTTRHFAESRMFGPTLYPPDIYLSPPMQAQYTARVTPLTWLHPRYADYLRLAVR